MGDTCVTDCENVVKGELPVRPVQSESIYLK
jgi:hypothetical protein